MVLTESVSAPLRCHFGWMYRSAGMFECSLKVSSRHPAEVLKIILKSSDQSREPLFEAAPVP